MEASVCYTCLVRAFVLFQVWFRKTEWESSSACACIYLDFMFNVILGLCACSVPAVRMQILGWCMAADSDRAWRGLNSPVALAVQSYPLTLPIDFSLAHFWLFLSFLWWFSVILMYIYAYTYVCIYVCVCVYMCVCVYVYIRIYIVCVCVCVCIYSPWSQKTIKRFFLDTSKMVKLEIHFFPL